MDRLNEWYKPYENITRIKIDEAQKLSKRARLETNLAIKKQLYNKLILGTMYVIYNYIINNNFYLVVNQDIDIDDLTSSFTRQWITLIKSGALEKYSSFSKAINVTRLAAKAIKGISNDRLTKSDKWPKYVPNNMFTKDDIDRFIQVYINIIVQKGVCRIDDFMTAFGDNITSLDAGLIIDTFNSLYDNGWIKRFFGKKSSSSSDYEIIYQTLRDKKVGIFDMDDLEEKHNIDEDIDQDFHISVVNDTLDAIDERSRQVIVKRFGLDGNAPMDLDNIATDLGITRERVRQLEAKAFWKIRYILARRSSSQDNNYTFYEWVKKGYPLTKKDFDILKEYLTEEEIEVAKSLYGFDEVRTELSIREELGITKEYYNFILNNIEVVLKNTPYHVRDTDTLDNYHLDSPNSSVLKL